jgi:hypothetical protein
MSRVTRPLIRVGTRSLPYITWLTKIGQYRVSFEVAVTASNGYNKDAPPAKIAGFSGPTQFGGAISVSKATSMGYVYYPYSEAQGQFIVPN